MRSSDDGFDVPARHRIERRDQPLAQQLFQMRHSGNLSASRMERPTHSSPHSLYGGAWHRGLTFRTRALAIRAGEGAETGPPGPVHP